MRFITEQEVRKRVKDIRQCAWDYDAAHGMEDKLYELVMQHIALGAPNSVSLARAVLETKNIEFARYTA